MLEGESGFVPVEYRPESQYSGAEIAAAHEKVKGNAAGRGLNTREKAILSSENTRPINVPTKRTNGAFTEEETQAATARAKHDVKGHNLTPQEKLIIGSLPTRAVDAHRVLTPEELEANREKLEKENADRQNFLRILEEMDAADAVAGRAQPEPEGEVEYELPPGIRLTPANREKYIRDVKESKREFIQNLFGNALENGALLIAFWKLREAYTYQLPAETCQAMRADLLAALDRLLAIPDDKFKDARYAEIFRRDLRQMRESVSQEKFVEADFDLTHSPTEAEKGKTWAEYQVRFDNALELGKLDTAYAYFQWGMRERLPKNELEDMRAELLWAIDLALEKTDQVLSEEMQERLDTLREATVRLV